MTMHSTVVKILLASLNLVKRFFDGEGVQIDTIVFRFLTRYSAVAFAGCFIINALCLCLTGPVLCVSDDEDISQILDTYCWITAMYTLPDAENTNEDLQPHPGVRQQQSSDKKNFLRFYQYTYMVLFLQALAFIWPRYLWNIFEGGRVHCVKEQVDKIGKMTLRDLKTEKNEETQRNPLENERRSEKKKLVLFVHHRLDHNTLYFASFVFCDLFAVAHLFFQMYLMTLFLGNEYSTYGLDILFRKDFSQEIDPVDKVFPKVSKCTLNAVGPAGGVVLHDALCVLNINVINEKIYLFLWFWCALVLCLSICGLLYRVANICSSKFRMCLIKRQLHKGAFRSENMDDFLRGLEMSDWFFLNLIRKNLDTVSFTYLITSLVRENVGKGFEYKHRPLGVTERDNILV